MSVAIRVSPDTRAKLKTIGQKGETYDDVIRQLIIDKEADNAIIEGLKATISQYRREH